MYMLHRTLFLFQSGNRLEKKSSSSSCIFYNQMEDGKSRRSKSAKKSKSHKRFDVTRSMEEVRGDIVKGKPCAPLSAFYLRTLEEQIAEIAWKE
ncbi:hypothetical protein Ocin01_08200 [Orchesella cincta]|uniref:Uncharacterized protein n=1 Tax=Orchesella cincta TaxID=48709 RepID=A0A1D2N0P7_ORCCI|nr:hypothetical protein Ocin01_08200 [Orchesella cincta]